MTLEQRYAGAGEHIIYSCDTIGTRSRKFVACAVKTGIEYLIIMAAESFDALTTANIPELASTIDTSC